MEIRKVSNERFQLLLLLMVLAAVLHIASTCSAGCKCGYDNEKGHVMECYNISSFIFENVPSQIQTLLVDGGKVDRLNNKTLEVFKNLQNFKVSKVSLTLIEPYTFMGMTSLTSIHFSHVEIKKLVNNTFYDLPNLKNISFTDGVLEDLDADWIQKSNEVKYLNFSNNAFTLLRHYYFTDLPNLLSIIFDNNKISDINENTFIKNTELIQLHLNTNQFIGLKRHHFKYLKRLRILNLQKNEISFINYGLRELEELRELYLNHNKISFIWFLDFQDLMRLEKLNLSNNVIDSINYKSKPLRYQAKLQTLDLSNNKFTLPIRSDDFYGLHGLELLYLDNNAIYGSYQSTFSHTPELLMLSLKHNKVTSMSSLDLSGLSKLKELYLNENFITDVYSPHSANLTSLQRFELTSNKIREIKPNYFNDLKNLVYLDISQNIISTLQDYSFGHLDKLNRLVMSQNRFTKLTNASFFGLKELSILEIDDNDIYDIYSDALKPLINVEYFSIQRNQLDLRKTITNSVFNALQNVRKIMLGGHNLEILDSEILQPLQNVEEVYLDNCGVTNINLELIDSKTTLIKSLQLFQNSLTEVNGDFLVKLISLETLNLNNNQINKIERHAFQFSNKMLRLSLVGNKIMEITENHLHGLHSLKILDISSNIIENISESALDDLVSLEELYMSKNNLKKIPANILQHMKNLKKLNISMNPLQFSCYLYSSLRDILTSKISHDLSKPTFGYPNWLQGLSVTEVEQLLSLGPSTCENHVCYYEYNISCDIAREKYGKTCDSDLSCGCEAENGKGNCFPKTDCRIQKCDNEGVCNNLNGRWKCICKPGWNGTFCSNSSCDHSLYGEDCSTKPYICNNTECGENGECFPDNASFICKCKPGYTGRTCETDSCQVNNCQNGATCVPYEETYNCTCATDYEGIYCEKTKCPQSGCVNQCPDGFYGTFCNETIYVCDNTECKNNGDCISRNSSFTCDCKPGYTGRTCETDSCQVNNCQNGATCVPHEETYNCSCATDYEGIYCKNKKCPQSGCVNQCPDGFYGTFCNETIYVCDNTECKNNGDCISRNSSFTCDCKPGYTGRTCETDSCQVNNCQNGATCVPYEETYNCTCATDYEGIYCEKKKCPQSGCVNQCPDGFYGTFCNETIYVCDNTECKNNGDCISRNSSFTCDCKPGYTGRTCETDSCQVNNCQNGATCVPYEETYNCSCATDYEGIYCEKKKCPQSGCISECPDGFYGTFCNETIYVCDNTECKNNGDCISRNSSFICDCKPGYTGRTCETDSCQVNNCQNGATCVPYEETYNCSCATDYEGIYCEKKKCPQSGCINECPDGFYGENCDKPIYKCNKNECQNNGNCKPKNSSYICSCKPGYIGANCETLESNLCNINPCKNGGTCLRYDNTYFCRCPSNFDGDNCENEEKEEKEEKGFFKSTMNIILVCIIFTLILFVVVLMVFCYRKKQKRQGKNNLNRPTFNNPTFEREENYYTGAVDEPAYAHVYSKNDYK